MKGARSVSRIFFLHFVPAFQHLLKILSFLHGIAFASLSKTSGLPGCISGLSTLFHSCIYLLFRQYHTGFYCSFTGSLEVTVILQLFSLSAVLPILHLFTFNVYVSLYPKWVSCIHHIGESCFLLTLKACFLIGVFRPTMFKLIPGNWINIYLIFTVFYSLPLFLVSSVIFQSISDFSGFNPAFKLLHFLSSLQFRSVTQLRLTLCNPMDCSTPGFPVLHQLPELTQTHVHRVSDAIQPSHPLLSPSSLTFNLSQHQGLFQ